MAVLATLQFYAKTFLMYSIMLPFLVIAILASPWLVYHNDTANMNFYVSLWLRKILYPFLQISIEIDESEYRIRNRHPSPCVVVINHQASLDLVRIYYLTHSVCDGVLRPSTRCCPYKELSAIRPSLWFLP
jgi:1-acyl-sn-glycerol-3-phosphate acyltransferase